ncbi:hypothetical protein [Marimonas lutisalis]|uniref:hypothetical protein n=1 Tax=Marimonas lutisalis TaxID=2545756 RepID=UPI0010F80512|nr:hypothetical protein [Marimonas lutisalis]
MRFWLLQLRYHTGAWWGPVVIAVGAIALVLGVSNDLGSGFVWGGIALVGIGIVRAAWQSRGRALSDYDGTNYPADTCASGGSDD